MRWRKSLEVGIGATVATLSSMGMFSPADAATPSAWLYYNGYPVANCFASEIWRSHLDGSGAQRVLPVAYGTSSGEPTFSVSRDGRFLVRVLGTLADSPTQHLFVYDLTTGTTRQLTFGSHAEDSAPAISPDGTRVAYGHSANGRSHPVIDLIPLAGGSPRVVSRPGFRFLGHITWLSGGTQIENGGIVTNLQTGKSKDWIKPTRAYDPLIMSTTWTPFGIVYTAETIYDSDFGGKPQPTGLYLAAKPVRGVGKLLRRYAFNGHPAPNGIYGMQIVPGTHTLVGQISNRIVSGNVRGRLTPIPLPGIARNPVLGGVSDTPLVPAPTPAAGQEPGCASKQ